jgi:hypothetical protein
MINSIIASRSYYVVLPGRPPNISLLSVESDSAAIHILVGHSRFLDAVQSEDVVGRVQRELQVALLDA